MVEWITTSEAVALSGYNAEYIRRLVRRKLIKAQKFGTTWQIDKSSLLTYLQQTEHSADGRRGPHTEA